MSFYKFWQKRNAKASFSQESTEFDLSFELSYLSTISASGVPRSKIFELAGELPCGTAKYFRNVYIMCVKLGYDYPEACRLVGQNVRHWEVKSLFLRLADALSAGESEMAFFAKEAEIQTEKYGDQYVRKLESLSKWTDAYVSLIVSVTLIVLVAIISMIIYTVSTGMLIGLVFVTLMVSGGGVFVIWKAIPKEVKTHPVSEGSPAQILCRKLFRILAPTAALLCAVLAWTGVPMGWVMVIGGVIIMPVGLISMWGERKIDHQDQEIGTFVRSLGSVSSGSGTPISEAAGRIDLRATGSLIPEIRRLRARLSARIEPELCWQHFVFETGSELVNRTVGMFQDACAMGADAEEAGKRSSVLAMKVSMMRAKRKMVSQTFTWLSFGVHAVSVALFVFIVYIVETFGEVVRGVQSEVPNETGSSADTSLPLGNMFSFGFNNVELLYSLVLPVVLCLTVVNALAPKLTDGGDKFKFLFYLGVTLIISGGLLVWIPKVAGQFFASVAGPGSGETT